MHICSAGHILLFTDYEIKTYVDGVRSWVRFTSRCGPSARVLMDFKDHRPLKAQVREQGAGTWSTCLWDRHREEDDLEKRRFAMRTSRLLSLS